jgi:hypothetical protein
MNGVSHSPANGNHANGSSNGKKRKFSEIGMNGKNADPKSQLSKPKTGDILAIKKKKMEEHRRKLPIYEGKRLSE